ncbi:hypothetical protein [Streptomyces sp. TE33382]
MSTDDWHILSTPPVDSFDGMTPLAKYLSPDLRVDVFDDPHKVQRAIKEYRERLGWAEKMNAGTLLGSEESDYYIEQDKERLDWAAAALDALQRGSGHVGWEGDFRHEPYVGALPWPENAGRYLLVKQGNNGTCFIISQGFTVPVPQDANRSAYQHVSVRKA